MAYFKHLPNILYQSPLPDKKSTGDLIEIKNIFILSTTNPTVTLNPSETQVNTSVQP